MPNFDVSDLLPSPGSCDANLYCRRNAQTEKGGITSNAKMHQQSGEVVTATRSLEARRMQAEQPATDAIRVVAGKSGLDANIVGYDGADYRVTFVDPYPCNGTGLVQAHGELQPSDGGPNE